MMRFRLESDEGLPWTAATPFGWIVLLVVLTSGTAAYLLALYLAVWIRSKGRSALPLYGFGLVMLAVPLETLAPASSLAEWGISLLTGVWIAATFSLRHEVKTYFRDSEGWNVEMGYVMTFFFSSMYINYCLNPVTFNHANTVTSLNLVEPQQQAVQANSVSPRT